MAKDEETLGHATREITHVIFDMDGLLLDTEPFYTVVQEKILERFGKTFDWSLKAKLMGKKAIESARIFVEECGLTGILTPEEFLEEREGMLQELFPTCQILPGVKRLVSHLHVNRIPMCVATGSYKRHFDLKTQRHGEIFSMMHHVVMGDDPDVKQGKPSPDIFLVAANRFESRVDPTKVLVFEDAPVGVAAAKNAGIPRSTRRLNRPNDSISRWTLFLSTRITRPTPLPALEVCSNGSGSTVGCFTSYRGGPGSYFSVGFQSKSMGSASI